MPIIIEIPDACKDCAFATPVLSGVASSWTSEIQNVKFKGWHCSLFQKDVTDGRCCICKQVEVDEC